MIQGADRTEMGDREHEAPEDVLAWALATYQPRIALAASFGAEDVVLIHMLHQLAANVPVFTLDTGRLPVETYDLIDQVRKRYGITIEVYFPQTQAVEAMVRESGVNLFYESVAQRRRCCGVRKVEPLVRALRGLDAWITGLRRDQAPTRADVRKVETDAEHAGLVKVNPLADWTWGEVWTYVRRHDVPYNVLHDQGFASIGCAPCTRAVGPGDDLRSGRWWWEQESISKECGLHLGAGQPRPAEGSP